MPGWVARQLDRGLAGNSERWQRVKVDYRQIARALELTGLPFVVLKGFAHSPDFVPEPRLRAQYDFDLWCLPDRVFAARDAALRLGYRPLDGFDHHPLDHLPTMVRKTGWEWRGNQFDPDLPTSLELHFRLWDSATEGFEPRGLDDFWMRRQARVVEDLRFTGLHPADSLGYAALHAARHLLRGDLRPSHIYEIAWFLDRHTDQRFWTEWRELHDPSLRRVEAICFAIAREWFDCGMHEAAAGEIGQLPEQVARWLAAYAYAPLAGLFHPNKDELWLHLSLLDPGSSKLQVMRRRLFPIQLPGPVDAVHLPAHAITWRIRVRGWRRYGRFVMARVWRHTRVLLPALWTGARWHVAGHGTRGELGRDFWRFFAAAAIYDFGLFIFFLLYNLYLLQLGYREDFLGWMSSAMLAGGITGSLPAGLALRRFGIRRSLLACFGLAIAIGILRVAVESRTALLALAFVSGAAGSLWPVLVAPAIAGLTSEKNRARGFSIVFSSGIAIGILGGLVGGRLPAWFAWLRPGASTVAHYRWALWSGCAVVLLALWPAWRLRVEAVHAGEEKRGGKLSPGLIRFLAAAAIWNLGTGAFNPFFNAFFSRLRMPVESIGAVFSGAQLAQVAAILIAPWVLRQAGLMRGISGMQLASAVALFCLASVAGPAVASLLYGAYMVFQYMSEPGMYSYLMDCVPASGRSRASAWNVLVASSAQALAAALAGASVSRWGYPPVLVAAAVTCVLAAALFRWLLLPPAQACAADTA